MKSPAGYGQPRRKAAAQKQVRLDLRRPAPPPPPEDELDRRQKSSFWKWFGIVALFHLLLLIGFTIYYRATPAPVPPTQFISLVPQGDTVKGTPGTQAAPKLGVTTPAPAHHPSEPQPVPPPEPAPTPPPVATQPAPDIDHPKPIVKADEPLAIHKPLHKPKPKPKPKVKVDLTLADAPDTPEKPVAKPRHHKSHPTVSRDKDDQPDQDNPDTMGLSKEQIAAKLGHKLDSAGVHNAEKTGVSGSADGHNSDFSDFYSSIHDQFMDKWQDPNQNDPNAVDPIVQIHVERDGQVPADRVTLLRSSGNPAIDDSALQAARSLGSLLQPLPDGCPPDISITLKLIR